MTCYTVFSDSSKSFVHHGQPAMQRMKYPLLGTIHLTKYILTEQHMPAPRQNNGKRRKPDGGMSCLAIYELLWRRRVQRETAQRQRYLHIRFFHQRFLASDWVKRSLSTSYVRPLMAICMASASSLLTIPMVPFTQRLPISLATIITSAPTLSLSSLVMGKTFSRFGF